jgi:DNA (cytosine-5)-methyltransferase 1
MKYVDLFAGCGGLSIGMERAGFELVLAVEKSDMAARTFVHNFVKDASNLAEWRKYCAADIDSQVDKGVLVKELSALLADESSITRLNAEKIDVIVGGPPCQGFSLAGKRNPDDARNRLPWEFLEFVARTTPKAVVIENVVGMKQKFAPDVESSFEQLQVALRETEPGYVVQGVEVNAMHYGAPQHRPRLMIIGLRQDIAKAAGVKSTGKLWKSAFLDELSVPLPELAPVPTVSSDNQRTVGDAIADLATKAPDGLLHGNREYVAELRSPEWGPSPRAGLSATNNIQRKHAARTITRFALYQFLANTQIDQRLLSRIAHMREDSARSELEAALALVTYPASSPAGLILARNQEELIELCMSLATKKHSQKVLNWKAPARTVVTIPDDYVHPSEPRLFTVRELARFQGFPDAFEFLGKETTGAQRRKVEVPQYSQVGNAVSPWLAWAVGQRLFDLLGGCKDESTNS